MHLTNLHTHTKYCDGKNSAEDMIIAAINSNMQSIGISTHGPADFASDWNIQKKDVEKYIEEINYLKQKYEGTIDVLLGMEFEYMPDTEFGSMCTDLMKRLDYYIGSVHYLSALKNGSMWTVDCNIDELLTGINESFGGNKKHAVEKYYDLISEMAVKYEPPIIGHLDLFKKNNKNNILFDEKADWYVKTVEKCLDVIKNTTSIIEINTGGISRGYIYEQYPSTFILGMIRDKNIPIIINSDAHTTDGITCKFDDMYTLINQLKFESISYLTKTGWKKQALTS